MALSDMEFQIHAIEIEAYSSVLRAFIAQSEQLSWDKEGLISELRKELRVSDEEHREILVRVDLDDSIRMIREWRNGTSGQPELVSNTRNTPSSVPILTGIPPWKKFKMTHNARTSSPTYLSHAQQSPAPFASSVAMHIRDKQRGYDIGIVSTQGNAGQSLKSVTHNRQGLHVAKGRGRLVFQSKEGALSPVVDGFRTGSDTIEIHATDKLIYEIERVLRADNPDPTQVEKARHILEEHERSLLEAIEKLAHLIDGDDSPDHLQQNHFSEQLSGFAQVARTRL